MSSIRKWSLVTAVLIVAVLAASWFLLVSPKRSQAAELKTQATAQQASNDALLQQLAQLKEQSKDLPAQKAQLALFRKQIPSNPALPTLVRDLTTAGRKVGIGLLSIKPGAPALAAVQAPVAVAAPVPATTDPAATDPAATDPAATDPAAVPAAAPAAPLAASQLYLLPLTLEVSGSYFEIEQFLNKLEGMRRSFLVTGFSLTRAPAVVSTTGSTSEDTGDLSLSLNGRVFLSPDVVAAAPSVITPTPVAPATALAN